MPSRAFAGLISIAIGVLSVLRVAQVWDRLPERMASHYGASGQPNGFMMRNDFFIFYVGIFGFVTALLFAVPTLMSRIPRELVNIPHREYWLADERWPEAMERMSRWMAWFAVAMVILSAGVLQLVLRSNLQHAPLENGPMLFLLGGFFIFTGVWLVALYRAFRPPV